MILSQYYKYKYYKIFYTIFISWLTITTFTINETMSNVSNMWMIRFVLLWIIKYCPTEKPKIWTWRFKIMSPGDVIPGFVSYLRQLRALKPKQIRCSSFLSLFIYCRKILCVYTCDKSILSKVRSTQCVYLLFQTNNVWMVQVHKSCIIFLIFLSIATKLYIFYT